MATAVPRNALPAPHQPEAALGVQRTAGGIILQNGGLQRPVPGFFGSGAQGAQQLEAQPVPAELLACVKTGKWFTLEVTGVMGFDSAQVTAGGVPGGPGRYTAADRRPRHR